MDDQGRVEKKIAWLKYAVMAAFILLVINVGLFFVNKKLNQKSLIRTKDKEGFLLTIPDQRISKEGYSIIFSNPRYEHLEGQSSFKVDVSLVNKSFMPFVKIIVNCDISENGVLVKEGEGISIESGESTEVAPGGSASWTALVILENQNQQVVSCLYAPEGVFDPNQSVKVIF